MEIDELGNPDDITRLGDALNGLHAAWTSDIEPILDEWARMKAQQTFRSEELSNLALTRRSLGASEELLEVFPKLHHECYALARWLEKRQKEEDGGGSLLGTIIGGVNDYVVKPADATADFVLGPLYDRDDD